MGLLLLGVYVAARLHGAVLSRVSVHRFSLAAQAKPGLVDTAGIQGATGRDIDFSLWSMKRIAAYEDSLTRHFAPPLALLKIPRLGLEVPVLDGTDDLTLNRGVGRITGTAHPGKGGNLGIAGHRDGFFRILKDVVVGDRIELNMPTGTEIYIADQIRIVDPENVQVLEDRGVPTITLVTCYPFYFIGNAPQRFIVRASVSDDQLNRKASIPRSAMGEIDP
ncbi:MAG TPA: class D sortase [Terriglobia bacterium]